MDNNYQENNYDTMQSVQPEKAAEEITNQTPKDIRQLFAKITDLKPLLIKLLIPVIAAVTVIAGVSALLYNLVFFPRLDEALILAIEPKLDINTNFDFYSFANKGTVKLEAGDLDIGQIENISAAVSFDVKKRAVGVFGAINDEKVSIIATEKGVAVNENNFNDGKYYGFPFKNLLENIKASAFGPDSDTDYSIPEEIFDYIEQAFEYRDELAEKGLDKDLEIVIKEIMDVVSKSELAKAKNQFFGVEVAGSSRAGRSQTFSINEKNVRRLIKDLADMFEEPSKKFEKALNNVLEFIDEVGNAPDADDIADLLDQAAEELSDSDEEFDFSVKFVYVGRALSAIEIVFEAPTNKGEGSVETVIDFGEKPRKSTAVTIDMTVKSEYEADGEAYTEISELHGKYELKSEKKGVNEITVTGEIIHSLDGYSDTRTFDASISLNAKEETASMTANIGKTIKWNDGDIHENTAGIFANAKYKDTKDVWSVTPINFGAYEGEETEETEPPVSVTVSLLRKTEKLSLPKYKNVLRMKEGEIEDLVESFLEFGTDLAAKYSGLGDLGDLGDIGNIDDLDDLKDFLDDLFGGNQGTAIPDIYPYGSEE